MKKEWIFISLIMSIVFATSRTWADSPAQEESAVALPSIHFERLGDSLPAKAAQTGSIVGWGEQVVGVDTSAGFIAIAAGRKSQGCQFAFFRPSKLFFFNCPGC